MGDPLPMYRADVAPAGPAAARHDQPCLPNYAWPSYAAYPNYAAVTYPKQYSPTAWPYIGPFYPYPQVPLGWRKVTLEWSDGWWFLDFKDHQLAVGSDSPCRRDSRLLAQRNDLEAPTGQGRMGVFVGLGDLGDDLASMAEQ